MLRNRPIRNRLISGITTVFSIAMILVVLVLFVIEAAYAPPFHSHNNSVELPKVDHSVWLRCALREDAITIIITRDSRVLYDNDFMLARDLPPKILQDLRHGPEAKVYLRVDASARYGLVKDVLDSIRSVGIENVAFFVNQRPPALRL